MLFVSDAISSFPTYRFNQCFLFSSVKSVEPKNRRQSDDIYIAINVGSTLAFKNYSFWGVKDTPWRNTFGQTFNFWKKKNIFLYQLQRFYTKLLFLCELYSFNGWKVLKIAFSWDPVFEHVPSRSASSARHVISTCFWHLRVRSVSLAIFYIC